MNNQKVMAALILSFFSLLIMLSVLGTDAEIHAYGVDNRTRTFNDEESSFGPGVGYSGLVGVLYRSQPLDACSTIKPPTKASSSNLTIFNIVLIARGGCDFALKVLNAQRSGYAAAIVYNINSNELLHMGSGIPEISSQVTIPSVFVGQDTATILNDSYLYREWQTPYIELVESPFNPIDYYLVPFVVVTGICFVCLLCFLTVRCLRDYRRTRRSRLSLRRLKKLPVKKYKKEDEYDVCAICLEDYDEGDSLRILPCKHAYHCKCVDPWLTSSKRICPLCKRKVLSDDESTGSTVEMDSSDDESTPLVPASDAASPNAPRYGTGYSLRNPFTNRGRFFERRVSELSIASTSTDTSEIISETAGTSAQTASRIWVQSGVESTQELSAVNVADAEVSQIMNSEESDQRDANNYLVSAEVMLTRRSRISESSIAVLSDDDREELSPDPPSCSSTDYHTVDESILTARTPYNLESRLEIPPDSNQEDIIVIATGSTAIVQEEEEV